MKKNKHKEEINIKIKEENEDNALEEMEFVFNDDDLEQEDLDFEDYILKNRKNKETKKEPAFFTKEEREKHAEENIRIVYAVAKQYYNDNHSMDELSSVGYKGFTKALNSFDKNRGVKFSTYAWTCVNFDILHYLRRENKHLFNQVSINSILNVDDSGNEMELGDILRDVDYGARTNDQSVIISEVISLMNDIIDDLSENERHILIYRFGLRGQRIKTQEEIGNEIGMSQANVSKLEQTIMYKVKMLLSSRHKIRNLDDI